MSELESIVSTVAAGTVFFGFAMYCLLDRWCEHKEKIAKVDALPTHIDRLDVQPDEALLITVPDAFNTATMRSLREYVSAAAPDGVKVVVLKESMGVAIVEKSEQLEAYDRELDATQPG